MPQFDILGDIVTDVTKTYSHLMNCEKNCVIHLRLGDALNDQFMQLGYAPFKETVINDCISKYVPEDYSIDIVHISDDAYNSDPSMQTCMQKSHIYVNNLVTLLKNKYSKINILNKSHPDIDFCRMVNADVFVAGKGGFSGLAVNLRNYRAQQHKSIPGIVTLFFPDTTPDIYYEEGVSVGRAHLV